MSYYVLYSNQENALWIVSAHDFLFTYDEYFMKDYAPIGVL